ncbi:MAG TPA: MauE/DoxX family redox-associated membrane protein [Woeseiaceae bacterium]|nr:MauE/DoxX family redox-associated membrane protein [Woeseiaceae bacterium]
MFTLMDTLDPVFGLIARCVLAFVFGLALLHKLLAPLAFAATLRNYRLLPAVLATPAAYLLIGLELLAVTGLLLGVHGAALLAGVLLAVYTVAIAINYARGLRDIDCGCSGPAMSQPLDGWLIVRNAGLIIVALLAAMPVSSRPLNFLDVVTTLTALLAFALIYISANRLAAINSRFVRDSGVM